MDRFGVKFEVGQFIVYDDQIYFLTRIAKSHLEGMNVVFYRDMYTKKPSSYHVYQMPSKLKTWRNAIVLPVEMVMFGEEIKEKYGSNQL